MKDGEEEELEKEGDVVASALDNWIFCDDSTEDVEVEEAKESKEVDGVRADSLEEVTTGSVWVALDCSEVDIVETSVIFSVVEETTEFAKVTGYTLVVV